MSQPSLASEVANLHATLQALESRVASGEVPSESLAEFKSTVDDPRLRLWGPDERGDCERLSGLPGAVPAAPHPGDL